MYDWGAHFLDWMLNLVPARITQVMGNFQKRVWNAVTNRGLRAGVYPLCQWRHRRLHQFQYRPPVPARNGASTAPKAPSNRTGATSPLITFVNGIRQDSVVKVTLPGYGSTEYYRNVADHLLMGEELAVKPEQARRVIGVIEAAQFSSQQGTSVPPPDRCEDDPGAVKPYIGAVV